MITFEDFKKLDIRIGEIKFVEKVEDTDRLLKIMVDFGNEELTQVVAGIAPFFKEYENLIGKKCPFLVNLEPREVKGVSSNAMILATSNDDGDFALIIPDREISSGSIIK